MVYLHGSPATVTQPNGNTFSGEEIAMDLAHNKVEVMSPTPADHGDV